MLSISTSGSAQQGGRARGLCAGGKGGPADLKSFESDFLNQSFPDDSAAATPPLKPPDLAALRRNADLAATPDAWRELGDACALWGGPVQIDAAIDAYSHARKLRQDDGKALFRLGVCYRLRYDSARRQPGDFQAAVDSWGSALATNPNQYIWRRRIQQYGPRLGKPYAFYD